MATVSPHDDVTSPTGGVDFTKIEVGDTVACMRKLGDYYHPGDSVYVYDPERNHPKAQSHHKLVKEPNKGLAGIWHHLQ